MPIKSKALSIGTVALPEEVLTSKIFVIRGKQIMLDADLAELYEVETGALKRQVKRNKERFPQDFMYQLTKKELKDLRCQFGTSSWGGTRYPPYAFTEQGVAMLSSVLNSPRAIHVNIQIMRVFSKLRALMVTHADLRQKIESVEKRLSDHDEEIQTIFNVMKQLIASPVKPKKEIGFHTSIKKK